MSMGLNLGLGLRRRIGATGGGAPPVEATSVTLRGVTFDWGVSYPAGVLSDGMAYVVAPAGVTLAQPTPLQTVDGVNAINGATVNPVIGVGNQGWDQRLASYDAGLTHTVWPRACAVGDIIVKNVSRVPIVDARNGTIDYAALIVLASVPTAGQEAPAAIGWAGRATPTPITLTRSLASVVLPDGHADLIPVGGTLPTYASIIAATDKMAPHCWRGNVLTYEHWLPSFGVGTGNYGEDFAGVMDFLLIAISHAAYTYAERLALARVLLRHGIQWADPAITGGNGWQSANGGHYQGHLGAIAFSLWCRGRESELSGLLSSIPGNYAQAMPLTPEILSKATPHDIAGNPADYRRRTISARTGTLISVPHLSGDTADVRFQSLLLTKSGVTAPVTNWVSDASPTLTFDIGAETGGTFAVSDVIHFTPPVTRTNAEFDFAISGRGDLGSWLQSPGAKYRTNICWHGLPLGLAALRILPPDWYPIDGYMTAAMQANVPAAGFDYPAPAGAVAITGAGANLHTTLWNTHAASLLARSMVITGKPRFMTASMWSVAVPGGVDNALDVTISSLPANGGATITNVEYTINSGGTWTPLGATSGTVRISGLSASLTTMALRAVNTNGGSADRSDYKTATPTGAAPVSNITVVGTATGTNTATMPAGLAVGDLVMVYAFRDGSATAPGIPAGYTTIESVGGSSMAHVAVKFTAASVSDVVGTFTNASSLICIVLRNHAGTGGFASSSAVTSSNVTYPAITMTQSNGTSWVLGFGATRAADSSIEIAPTGMTNRTSVKDATDGAALHDTNGGVPGWAGATAAIAGTPSNWRSIVVEVLST